MRRILLAALLAVAGALGTAATASADVGDIRDLDIDGQLGAIAEAIQVTGEIECVTNIEYGLVVKVTQNPDDAGDNDPGDNSDTEGTGAYGPNAGNEANSPCSTSEQDYEVIVGRSRDSDFFQQTGNQGQNLAGVEILAGTSAEDGDRGPGPFIGDSEFYYENNIVVVRSDP